MNRFLIVLSCLPFAAGAQTGLIFHKSHSGSPALFVSTFKGNFGAPPQSHIPIQFPKQQFTRINDSTVVVRHFTTGIENDTLVNDPVLSNPAISVDSLQKIYGEETQFIRFEQEPAYQVPPGQEHLPPLGIPEQEKPSKKAKRKKERRSDLWMLWVVAGGTFLGIGFGGSRKRTHSPTQVHA